MDSEWKIDQIVLFCFLDRTIIGGFSLDLDYILLHVSRSEDGSTYNNTFKMNVSPLDYFNIKSDTGREDTRHNLALDIQYKATVLHLGPRNTNPLYRAINCVSEWWCGDDIYFTFTGDSVDKLSHKIIHLYETLEPLVKKFPESLITGWAVMGGVGYRLRKLQNKDFVIPIPHLTHAGVSNTFIEVKKKKSKDFVELDIYRDVENGSGNWKRLYQNEKIDSPILYIIKYNCDDQMNCSIGLAKNQLGHPTEYRIINSLRIGEKSSDDSSDQLIPKDEVILVSRITIEDIIREPEANHTIIIKNVVAIYRKGVFSYV